MANEEHLAKLKEGVEAWNNWRKENPDIKVDLRGAELVNAHLVNADLSGAMLMKANLLSADLTYAKLVDAGLSGANLRGAKFFMANLSLAHTHRADLSGADLEQVNFSDAQLRETNFSDANLSDADLSGTIIRGSNFKRAILKRANFSNADLDYSNISSADFTQAIFYKTQMTCVRVTRKVEGLDSIFYQKDPSFHDRFETAELNLIEKYFGWDNLRKIGRLPLFAASYLTLILIPLFYYGLAIYNREVVDLLNWAKTVNNADPNYDIAKFFSETLHKQLIPTQSFVFVTSTAVLAIAATIYALFCPSRIQEFTRDVWTHQLGHPLVHYWPLAWKHRILRILCVLCYAVGGGGVLYVIFTKVFRAALFIWNNSSVSFF